LIHTSTPGDKFCISGYLFCTHQSKKSCAHRPESALLVKNEIRSVAGEAICSCTSRYEILPMESKSTGGIDIPPLFRYHWQCIGMTSAWREIVMIAVLFRHLRSQKMPAIRMPKKWRNPFGNI
jgi:hypothetical protein